MQMIWLYGVFLLGILLGFVNGILGLRALRFKAHPEAEITWQQHPLSPWRYETLSMVAVAIHSLGLLLLSAFLTFTVVSSYTFFSWITSGWTLFISIFAIIFTAYIVGVLIAFHLTQPWIRPISYGISKDGMWYGGSLIRWRNFSHHEIGPEDGFISLYSSYSPTLRTWVIQPPAETFASVRQLLQQNLPSALILSEFTPWQRSPRTLILGMALLILVALLPAAWAWFYHQTWGWIYCLVVFSLVLILGNTLITMFNGRSKSSAQKTQ